MDMYTLIYLKWKGNRPCCVAHGTLPNVNMAAWMGGEFGGEWRCAYVWLSPFAVHLKLPQHC